MQEVEQKNEELEEKMMHQTECEFEVKMSKNQPKRRSNI